MMTIFHDCKYVGVCHCRGVCCTWWCTCTIMLAHGDVKFVSSQKQWCATWKSLLGTNSWTHVFNLTLEICMRSDSHGYVLTHAYTISVTRTTESSMRFSLTKKLLVRCIFPSAPALGSASAARIATWQMLSSIHLPSRYWTDCSDARSTTPSALVWGSTSRGMIARCRSLFRGCSRFWQTSWDPAKVHPVLDCTNFVRVLVIVSRVLIARCRSWYFDNLRGNPDIWLQLRFVFWVLMHRLDALCSKVGLRDVDPWLEDAGGVTGSLDSSQIAILVFWESRKLMLGVKARVRETHGCERAWLFSKWQPWWRAVIGCLKMLPAYSCFFPFFRTFTNMRVYLTSSRRQPSRIIAIDVFSRTIRRLWSLAVVRWNFPM